MKTQYNLTTFNGSNDLNKLILVFVIGLLITTSLKIVILLSIFIIYLSTSLIDLIILYNEFNSNLFLKRLKIKQIII